LKTEDFFSSNYCLNPLHDDGKQKARLFAAVGITANDAEALRNVLLQVVRAHEAQLERREAYGHRDIVDSSLTWCGKQTTIRQGKV
jgi:hypothetical protein